MTILLFISDLGYTLYVGFINLLLLVLILRSQFGHKKSFKAFIISLKISMEEFVAGAPS